MHFDVCEPMWIATLGGAKYFVTFIDDYFGFATICFLKYKSQVLGNFQIFKTMVENQTRKIIKFFEWIMVVNLLVKSFHNFVK
jgi:hypothetical protein